MNAALKFSYIVLAQINRVMFTIQIHEDTWLFCLPIQPGDTRMSPYVLQDKHFESKHYCVVIYGGQLYIPIWSGKFEQAQCIVRYAERVIEAISYFFMVLDSEVLDVEPSQFGVDITEWHQFLNLVDAFSKTIHMDRKLKKMLKKRMFRHAVNVRKLRGLLEEIFENYFLPHEVMLAPKCP